MSSLRLGEPDAKMIFFMNRMIAQLLTVFIIKQ